MIPALAKKNVFKEVLMLIAIGFLFATSAMAQSDEASHEERRAAFGACMAELGIEKPAQGERPQAPDDETRAKIDDCMKEKGYELPQHGGGRPRGDFQGRRGAQ